MNIKKILMLLLFLVAIAGIIAPASAAIDSANSNDKVYSIESKEKSAANKITWNANGGKIGSKSTIATTVKKGSKIGKLPTTPKRSGYTFAGWYTKKTGGTKITANIKPTKSVSYYAQWKSTKITTKINIVGKWREMSSNDDFLIFKSDGSLIRSYIGYDQVMGTYKIKGDTIILDNDKTPTFWIKNKDRIDSNIFGYVRVK